MKTARDNSANNMCSAKNLSEIADVEFKSFLDSFDDVLCDCDGVVWVQNKTISGAPEAVEALKGAGKYVRYVSNNCTQNLESFARRFKKHGLDVSGSDIIYPTLAIIAYLQKIKFNKSVFVIGTQAMKNQMREAGLQMADEGPAVIEESIQVFFNAIKDNTEIGAVVVDWDVNVNYVKIQRAVTYLYRPDVIFINGATDETIPIGFHHNIIGPKHYQKIIEEMSGRTPLCLGKPGVDLGTFVNEEFNIDSPKRTLFVGDSLNQDMAFASNCGYQKLLVLSGNTDLEQLKGVSNNKKVSPDYYVSSLGDLVGLIAKRQLKNTYKL